MHIHRRELIKTVFAAACLRAFGATAFGATTTSVGAYVQRINRLVARHRRNVARLKAPAELVAERLLAVGNLSLGGSEAGWIREGSSRSGGIMHLGQVSPTTTVRPGDVAWLSYSADSYDAQLKVAAELESKKCLVMAFGPRPAGGVPGFQHWIDSLTPGSADQNFTLMGNVLSLWALTGEVAAASARRGKTLVFYQSGFVPAFHPEFKGRNERYNGRAFHEQGEPHMEPVQPGVAARAYLDSIDKMFRDIQAYELGKIVSVGKEIGRRPASRPALFIATSHLMHDEVLAGGKGFEPYKGDIPHLAAALGSDGYLIYLGYYDGVPPNVWEAVRQARARAAWIVVPLAGQKLNCEEYGDVFINQHWEFGDAAVAMPGYDVRILPPSGVAQLFIYELMMRAAASIS